MPTPLPDLRRLRVDLSTPAGTYAAGTLVTVLGGRRESRRVRVCLDPPGLHLARCRQSWLPAHAVTRRALVSGVRRAA